MAAPRLLALLVLSVAALLALPGLARAASPLERGSSGERVLALSERLAELSYLPTAGTSGRYTEATYHAVVAFQKYAGLEIDGVAGPKTLKALEEATDPAPLFAGPPKRIEVSLDRQLAFLVKGGVVTRVIHISTAGPGYVTPSGRFTISRKERLSWSVPYKVWLPWASYFSGGIAFHAYPDVPGYPASHGCVRVPPPFARELYEFASYGTPVIVG